MPEESGKSEMRAVNLYIAERIRHRRTLLNLTPAQLGQRLGITPEVVEKYESGQRSLDAVALWRMSKALHVGVDYFVHELLKKPASSGVGDSETTIRP